MTAVTLTTTTAPAQAACSQPTPTDATSYQRLLHGPVNGRWYGGDSGQSVALFGGRELWVFGDTPSGIVDAGGGSVRADRFTHNSALLVEGGCASVLLGPNDAQGKPTDWVKVPPALEVPGVDDYYWSNTPFLDGTYLRMFLLHEYNDANGFHPIGADLATFSLSTGTPQLVAVQKTPGARAYENSPMWGAAVVQTANYTYIFGSLNKHEFLVFGNYYSVARVPRGQVTLNSAWRYWNGSSWVSNQAAAVAVMSGDGGVGTSASVYASGSGYVLVGKQHDAFGTDLVAWRSTSLTGPWVEQQPHLLAPIPDVQAGEYTYLGLAHREIPMASGKLLVSWSLNNTDPSAFGLPRNGVYLAEVDGP
jgi:hypothetical protein